MKYSTNRTKGHTLIELMVVVVVIISLLLGLGINKVDYLMQWSKLNRAAALLSSELKNTQSRASYEGAYYKLQFLPSLDRYRVYKQTELIDDIILKDIDLFNTNFVIMTPVTARVRVSSNPPDNW